MPARKAEIDGIKLKTIRKKAGWTQEKLAKKASRRTTTITSNNISNYERRIQTTVLQTIMTRLVAELPDCTEKDLMPDPEPTKPSTRRKIYPLKDMNEIFENGLRLCRSAREKIRLLQVHGEKNPPPEVSQEMAKLLQESKKEDRTVTFDLYVGVPDVNTDSPELLAYAKERNSYHEKMGTTKQLKVYLIEVNPLLTFNLLIIDRCHAHIVAPLVPGVDHPLFSIVIENDEDIVGPLVDWLEAITRHYLDKQEKLKPLNILVAEQLAKLK